MSHRNLVGVVLALDAKTKERASGSKTIRNVSGGSAISAASASASACMRTRGRRADKRGRLDGRSIIFIGGGLAETQRAKVFGGRRRR